MTRPRIVIAEEIAEPGLERLRNAGFEVDIQLEKSPEDLRQCIVGASALIIRSATNVDAELLSAGNELVVVARAGVGLDNVDITVS